MFPVDCDWIAHGRLVVDHMELVWVVVVQLELKLSLNLCDVCSERHFQVPRSTWRARTSYSPSFRQHR